MATFKIDNQTSFELEEGEKVEFKNLPLTRIDKGGCLMSLLNLVTFGIAGAITKKKWEANIAVTNKRVVIVPIPPNEKNFPVESFYYSKITAIQAVANPDYKKAELWISESGNLHELVFFSNLSYVKAYKDVADKIKSGKSGEWLEKVASDNSEEFRKNMLPSMKTAFKTSDMEHIQKRDFLAAYIELPWEYYKKNNK